MDIQIKSAIIGAIIPTIGAFTIFFLGNFSTESKLERDTVQVLSEKFDSVEKDMSYEDALQAIFKENEYLKNQINDQQAQIIQKSSEEEIGKIIQNATEYGNSSNYIQALSILNNVNNKTHEIEILINDYSQKYESSVIEQANNLKTEEKLDDAINILSDALNVLPDSQILKNKLQELENSYPKNMIDAVPAYQSDGNPYTEYTSTKYGASEYFTMGGIRYTNGMTFNSDNWNNVTWAVYNLDNKYNNLEFILGHVDGSGIGNEACLEIYYDGELKEEISVAPDMLPKPVSLNLSGVSQLKMQMRSSGGGDPLYGLGNPMIK